LHDALPIYRDRHGLVGEDVVDGCVKAVAGAGDVALVGGAGVAPVAGGAAGDVVFEAVVEVEGGADGAEGLGPAGAVDVPVELVCGGVGEVAHDVAGGVLDDVGVPPVHVAVGVADAQHGEVAVGAALVGHGAAVGVGH